MKEERVLIKRTLKCGKNVWEEGTVLHPPLPPDILLEIEHNTGTVEVVGGFKPRIVPGNVLVSRTIA